MEQNDALAFDYFRQASPANPDALAHLGYMYLKGRHVEQDNNTAVEYFKLAASRVRPPSLCRRSSKLPHQGSTVGIVHLGLLHLRGEAVPQDLAAALRYFKSAADAVRRSLLLLLLLVLTRWQGSAEALSQLGEMHLYGWGVKVDYNKAYAYFQSAKKASHQGATYHLGRLHQIGVGPVGIVSLRLRLFVWSTHRCLGRCVVLPHRGGAVQASV